MGVCGPDGDRRCFMKIRLLAGTLGAMILLAPMACAQDDRKPSPSKSTEAKGSGMSEDMRQAIAFERAKDRAAARQARIEARKSGADRSADRVREDRSREDKDTGRKVKDTKAPGDKKDL